MRVVDDRLHQAAAECLPAMPPCMSRMAACTSMARLLLFI
jgi:hypothetical protein